VDGIFENRAYHKKKDYLENSFYIM